MGEEPGTHMQTAQEHTQAHESHTHAPHHRPKMPIKDRLYSYKWEILAAFVYLLVAIVIFYPLTLHITTLAPGSGADTYQNLWFFWWARYAVLNLHTNVFSTALLYWPLGASLVFQTMPPLLGLIYAPLQLVNLVMAYNVMFFIGFALSGLCMFILADYLVKDKRAAFIAGVVFTFSAFHFAQSYHIHFINIEWAPLFLYFLLRTINEKNNYWNVIGLAASFALSTLTANIEQTVIIFLLLPLVVIYYLISKEKRYKVLNKWFGIALAIFVVAAFVIGSWNYIPIIKAIASPGGLATAKSQNTPNYNAIWSDNLLAFFLPSYYNGIAWAAGLSNSRLYSSLYSPDPIERVAYIGYSVIILGLLALYKDRKAALPWLIGAIFFGWLCLGPVLQVGGSVTTIFGIYYIYHAIPLLNIVREPGRFQLLFTLCTAVLAAIGFKEVLKGIDRMKIDAAAMKNYKIAALALVSLIMLLELSGIPITSAYKAQITANATIPTIYSQLGKLQGNFSILSLPALPLNDSQPYLYQGTETYYTTASKKALVGGYLGRTNTTDAVLLYNIPLVLEDYDLLNYGQFTVSSPVTENYTNETLLTLYNYGTEIIVLQRQAYSSGALQEEAGYLYSVFGKPVYTDNSVVAFGTQEAINSSVFRSYVAYPTLSEWNQTLSFVNGSYIQRWYPTYPGEITLYAPYASNSSLQEAFASQQAQYIKTKISFAASSQIAQSLYIGEVEPNGINYTIVASAKLNSTAAPYTLNVTVLSGPEGSRLLFFTQYQSYPVYMSNLTFSKAG